jgi:hypothetical protein
MAAASVLPNPSVLPQGDLFSEVAPVPLVRQISELRWWGAVLYLDDNPNVDSCSASHPHKEWSWMLARTPKKGVYLQNTYYNEKLVISGEMNTNIEGRDEFIAHFFPTYKQKND